MHDTEPQRRTAPRSWLLAFAPVLALVLIAGAAAGCERNSQLVADEQIRESQNPCPKGCEMPVPGCTIKGVVSPEGDKRFVLPGNQFYRTLTVDAGRGERWFCSEVEAISNGFSRARAS